MTGGGPFYARPESSRCRAGLPGCTYDTEVHIYCNSEQKSIDVCQSCASVWRNNASAAGLYDRCPICTEWQPGTRQNRESPAAAAILVGWAADAIEAAMERESFTFEQRTRLLRRLAKDSVWLFAAEPGVPAVEYEYPSQWETIRVKDGRL